MADLLGWVTFLVAYFWVFSIFGFHHWWTNYRWFNRRSRHWQNNVAGLAMIAGAIALWLVWSYALPDWWRAATPLWTYD